MLSHTYAGQSPHEKGLTLQNSARSNLKAGSPLHLDSTAPHCDSTPRPAHGLKKENHN